MNYLLKNNRRDTSYSKPLIITFIILVIALIFYFFAPRFLRDDLFFLAKPFWNTQKYIDDKLSLLFLALENKEQLATSNVNLSEKLEEAQLKIITLDQYKKENENLKKILGRQNEDKVILATVLVRPNKSPYDVIILDIGTKQGVALGDKVMSEDFIIGKIEEVQNNFSKVTLYSSPGQSFDVRIGDSPVNTTAFGRGGGNFFAKLPKEVLVKKGDIVFVPSLSLKFFGTVLDVELTDASSFKYVLFTLPINMHSLEKVLVVKSSEI